jgi:hypothetical protein
MSRATRPLQMRDANGYIIPYHPADQKIRIVYAGATLRFYGKARPGALESAASWRIEKEVVNASGNTISMDYANSTLDYDNVWDSGAVMAITGITRANPAVVAVASTATLTTDDIVYIDEVGGMTEVNKDYFLITVINATTFSLRDVDDGSNINSAGYGAYTAGGKLYRPEFCNYTFA